MKESTDPGERIAQLVARHARAGTPAEPPAPALATNLVRLHPNERRHIARLLFELARALMGSPGATGTTRRSARQQ